ncbi:cytochrome P450 [Hygrophoropsis aurantiaca]|uniref:Cytochrome P450 n=1 Tax=Hygrophoropsis aurantiaca TaxID=72124 RepID=A0ACB8AJL5_9AGAM|nr:cytochrome P450 [Hygrophoropsis aurantiaca]
MSAAYGYEVTSHNDPYVAVIEKASAFIVKYFTPQPSAVIGAFPFRMFSLSRQISILTLDSYTPPKLVTGNVDKKKHAAERMGYTKMRVESPFKHVEDRMAEGTAAPSIASDYLRNFQENKGPTTSDIKEVSATAFSGKDRLPNFEDRASLPYIDAVFREVLRWYPVFPLVQVQLFRTATLKMMSMADITFLKAMSRDKTRYPKASEFIPDRFLDANGGLTDETVSFAWGFGRRI